MLETKLKTTDDVLKHSEESFDSTNDINILQIARDLGINVFEASFNDECSGFIEYDDEGMFNIYINKFNSKRRQRFTIGHEIAHYLLHENDIISNGRLDRNGDNKLNDEEENRADELAADILMPVNAVKKLYNKYDRQNPIHRIVEILAEEFEVSYIAMIVRLRKLNYYVPYIEIM